jgi:hypothetical protein
VARIVIIASVLALPLAGCGSVPDFDPTDWFAGDFFNTKKKLPGERKPVFPEGVPGVAQGIPPDLVKGNQPPPEVVNATGATPQASRPAPRQAAATPPEEFSPAPREKAKPKPKPKPKPQQAETERPPTAVTVRRSPEAQPQQQPPQQQGSAYPWPDPPQQQPQRSGSSGGIQWPDPPPMR